mmetsp:Transcript_3114/g.9516  ORF Transcript_3114/g.9516 Transcript_3114/m.9516 type:complete len:761 (+) Transcript_3114:90-2372(+)|eukprot:CAMPEP_0198728046 /NCGR_PEP_ID=MMETSP1475-20131203/6691_1 /TAXON_ID= ORGANISM="Unidentified sp., Strain CCMP1999" /NCGR_SAMPLE_ID=MMETSP1475 /ASSEMBLY_ACC=CAM_ASM_001111 /LENGTH=760 /DNA_ID=CAMNT_0044490293 /DNA_START=37 /DNA_END=2319 /DNA_ORIENTATION=+
MGCASSTEVGVRSGPSVNELASTPLGAPRSSLEIKPAIPTHETKSTASLSEGGGGGGYFGLLSNADKKTYERLQSIKKSRAMIHVSKEDDSVVADGVLRLEGVAMTVPYTILVAAPESERENIENIVQGVFNLVDLTFNNWNSKSEVSELNKLVAGKNMDVSLDLASLMDIIDRLHYLTGGRFDPTIETLGNFWRQKLDTQGQAPKQAECSHLKYAIGWQEKVVRKGFKVTLKNTNTALDLCGVAKGHAIDLLTDALVNAGYTSCYVDWGADIRAAGQHPSGRSWRTVVMSPPELRRLFKLWAIDSLQDVLTEEDAAYVVDLADLAVATSGDYFSIHKYGYHHIINKSTMEAMKASPTSVGSVSVFAKSCAVADGIATAAMTLSQLTEVEHFLKRIMAKTAGVSGYCIIARDGKMASAGSAQRIKKTARPAPRSERRPMRLSDEDRELLKGLASFMPEACTAMTVEGTTYLIETLTSCSLDPPMVSFHVPMAKSAIPPSSIVQLAVLNERHQKFAEKLRNLESLPFEAIKKELVGATTVVCSVRETMSGHDEELLKGVLVVVADVKEVFYSKQAPGALLVQNDIIKVAPRKREDMKDDATASSLPDLLRMSMGQSPSQVCFLTIRSIDGSNFAMTASSVRICRSKPEIITFNIIRDSSWGMSLTDKGTLCAIHFATSQYVAFAKRLADNSTLDEPMREPNSDPPRVKGLMALICEVVNVTTTGDHYFAQVRVISVEGDMQDPAVLPLIYFNKQFSSLEST